MRLPGRISLLFFIGIFAVGSTALGYYYYFVYSPPLLAADRFLSAMEARDVEALKRSIVISVDPDSLKMRDPEENDLERLLGEDFTRGRILDQRRREGVNMDFDYLIYREPDGQIYAMVVTQMGGRFRVVIPEKAMSARHQYLWEYAWTN